MPELNRARGSNSGKANQIATPLAKERVLKALKDGLKVRDAMLLVDRKVATYNGWRKEDPAFKAKVDQLREIANAARRRGQDGAAELPSFEEFCEVYLDQPVPLHHLRTLDMIRGAEPRELHPSMRYHKGRDNLLLINYPPDHAKSTCFSVNYPTYRIVENPNTRGIIISKTAGLATQFLGAIKNRLTNPRYSELQKAFAPEGGWESGDSWTQNRIYVGGRDSGEKDPTIQTIGMGGQVYGQRADWVVLDDCIDNSNAHDFEKQIRWLTTEVLTRLPDDGLVMILGTRIAAQDLYRKLREMLDYDETTPLYTYLAQPAVLDADGDSPEDWLTLWPERWSGPKLARRKGVLNNNARWALVYQQQDVSEEAVFPAGAVEASINKLRASGSLAQGLHGDLVVNESSLYVVGGLDPATTGKTAMMVVAFDRATNKRIVLDGFNRSNCPPTLLRETVKNLTIKHGIKEWVFERNAFQAYLSRDSELKDWLFQHGCILREHWTGANKHAADFGVMSMASLFLSCVDPIPGEPWRRKSGGGLIDLPNRKFSTWVDELVEQLIVWQPDQPRGVLQDLVMSLWFCEIACKRLIDGARSAPTHTDNPFLPRRERSRRQVINLSEAREAAIRARLGVQEVI